MNQSLIRLTRHFKKGLHPIQRLAFISLCCVAANAQAVVVQLNPQIDNTLYERPTGDLSNGAGDGLFFGLTGVNAGTVLRRALMSFNFAGTIPAGSVINDVNLAITVNMVPIGATPFDATLHRVNNSWGEGTSLPGGPGGSGASSTPGDATWIHRFFDTDLWSTPGGDFVAAPTATTAIGSAAGPFMFTSSPSLIADVQSWVDNPATNFGWIILGEEANPQNARRIASRENAVGAPVLTVDFTPPVNPPGPTAIAVPALNPAGIALLMLGIFVLMIRRSRSVSS